MIRATSESDNFAIQVEKKGAKAVIDNIAAKGLLDKRRKVLIKGTNVEIPVNELIREFIKESTIDYKIVIQESPEFYRSMPGLVDILKGEMTPEELDLLPRSWYILGDIIIVKIQPGLNGFAHRIGAALLDVYPRCRSVLRDFGIEGQFREPVREIIAGEVSETIHKENGVLFRLDAMKIMFSQGNLRERIRMSRLGKSETVVDMFAGIGYFSLPMALHSQPSRVMAIELNPVAYRYLVENTKLNHVEDIVQPILGDCIERTPKCEADRVVMGMVQVTDRYLKTGIRALRSGGVLHYHQTIPSWKFPDAAIGDVSKAAKALGLSAEILRCTRVKKYSPGVVHAVVDARIT
ncbi:MAG: class I SAM-dependent methyltransferase family protein [Methanotrichaceae archaeon]